MLFDKTKKYAVLAFALVCPASAGLLYAQPAPPIAPCVDLGNSPTLSNAVPCYFDVSFTLTESIPNAPFDSSTIPFVIYNPLAWDPRDDAGVRMEVENELRQFATSWCVATAGLSRINRITLYTDGRLGDFRLINGRGRARALSGGFRYTRPSSVVYKDGADDFFRNAGVQLNAVAAHELAHAALKIYDEYVEDSDSMSSRCSRPREGDDPPDTIMNAHWRYQRFSVASDYAGSPTPQTAQHRCYGKSAWETLVQPPSQDLEASISINSDWPRRRYFTTIPEGIEMTPETPFNFNGIPEAAYGCPEPDSTDLGDLVTWASDARRVVMLIDNSGSMTGEPTGMARRAAQQAVHTIAIENRPIQVAVVEFGEAASAVEFGEVSETGIAQGPLTMLGHRLATTRDDIYSTRISHISARIEGLRPPNGGTDFQAALEAAQTLLEVPPGDAQGMVIMLSDGQADTPDTSYFQENDVPIYTVGIGDYVDAGVLRKIAGDTGGESDFETENLDRLPDIFRGFLYGSGMVDNNQMISSDELSLAAVGFVPPTTTFNSVISGVSESANFVLRRKDGATLETFTLTRPDGVVIDKAYAMSTTVVAYLETPIQASYSVRFPSPGGWTASIKGDGDFTYEVTAYSLITAGISAGAEVLSRASKRTAVTYPEPIPISVNIEGVKQIVGADAVAEITRPDGTVVTLDLRDDGESPDETAEDGVYSGLLGDYDQDGVYDVEVVVRNLEGRARLGEEGASPSSSLLPPAPLFQRIVRGQVEVVGTAGKSAPAPTPDNPVEIEPDGILHWGSIEQPGQVNWYRFDAVAGTNYWLQTSRLAGHDGVEMATRLTLYESDAVTEIDSNARYRQSGASSIEWAASADGAYLVSVAHTDDEDRGIYGLTVGQRSILSEAAILRAQRTGGGGPVGWLLLLSLLAALAVSLFDGGRSRGRGGR